MKEVPVVSNWLLVSSSQHRALQVTTGNYKHLLSCAVARRQMSRPIREARQLVGQVHVAARSVPIHGQPEALAATADGLSSVWNNLSKLVQINEDL